MDLFSAAHWAGIGRGVVGWLLAVLPGAKTLYEKEVAIAILPEHGKDKPLCIVQVGQPFGSQVYTRFRIRVINHQGDRPYRILGVRVELREPRRWKRWQAVASFPALTIHNRIAVATVVEPNGEPYEIDVSAEGIYPAKSVPTGSELVVVFDAVGAFRNIERPLTRIENPG